MNSKLDQEIFKRWHNDTSNWKLGLFYYNKEDKRLLVSKRVRYMGWTINFAHESAYKVVFILIFTLATIFVVKYYYI